MREARVGMDWTQQKQKTDSQRESQNENLDRGNDKRAQRKKMMVQSKQRERRE